MKICYNNFWRSDEGVRLQCEFDIGAGVSAEDTILKTLFLVNFMTLLSLLSKMFFSFSVSQYFIVSILYNVLYTYLS